MERITKAARRGKYTQTIKRNMTDASKDSLIAAKNNRIKKLEEANERLKDDLLKITWNGLR